MRNAKDVSVAAIPRITEVVPLFRACLGGFGNPLPRSLPEVPSQFLRQSAVYFVPFAASIKANRQSHSYCAEVVPQNPLDEKQEVSNSSVSRPSFYLMSQGRQRSRPRAKNHLLAQHRMKNKGNGKSGEMVPTS